MQTFENKIIVITGAASGIGFATAKKAAQLQMKIVLADIHANNLNTALTEIKNITENVIAIPTDVSQENSINHLCKITQETFGIPHVLFNNAGIGGPVGSIWEIPLDKIQQTIDINLMAIVYAIRAFVPLMLTLQEPSHIINTASMAGFYTAPYIASYEMAKHGLVALSEALFHDLKLQTDLMKVSVLCPGWVNTNILNSNVKPDDQVVHMQNVTEQDEKWFLQFMRNLKKGDAPDDVASKIFEAIQKEKFYIFTDESMKDSILRKRIEAVMKDELPEPFKF